MPLKIAIGAEEDTGNGHLAARSLVVLDRSLPGNVTVEMGLALARLSPLVPPGSTVEDLERALVEKHSHHAFAEAWEDFLWTYGHRGVGELDVAAPRYRESPRVLLQQVAQAAGASDAHDAAAIYRRSLDARERARSVALRIPKLRDCKIHRIDDDLRREETSLFITEGDANASRATLNDWEIASRLSYLLWSSMPDAELFATAASGRLTEPAASRRSRVPRDNSLGYRGSRDDQESAHRLVPADVFLK